MTIEIFFDSRRSEKIVRKDVVLKCAAKDLIIIGAYCSHISQSNRTAFIRFALNQVDSGENLNISESTISGIMDVNIVKVQSCHKDGTCTVKVNWVNNGFTTFKTDLKLKKGRYNVQIDRGFIYAARPLQDRMTEYENRQRGKQASLH